MLFRLKNSSFAFLPLCLFLLFTSSLFHLISVLAVVVFFCPKEDTCLATLIHLDKSLNPCLMHFRGENHFQCLSKERENPILRDRIYSYYLFCSELHSFQSNQIKQTKEEKQKQSSVLLKDYSQQWTACAATASASAAADDDAVVSRKKRRKSKILFSSHSVSHACNAK